MTSAAEWDIFSALREVVELDLNEGATASALFCLRAIARDGVFAAARALALALGQKLAPEWDRDRSGNTATLTEFMRSDDIPEICRLYVLGFFPIYYYENKTRCEELEKEVKARFPIEPL